MKAAKFAIVLLFFLQAMLPYLLPLRPLYDYRLREDRFTADSPNFHAVLDRLKVEIEDNRIRDYIVILGDSIAYGSAVSADESVGYYMEQLRVKEGGYGKPAVFNLALPGMQAGDVYAMLLLLDEYGISTDRVAVSMRYNDFAPRQTGPAIASLLPDTLRRLDRDSFSKAEPQLTASGYTPASGFLSSSLAYAKSKLFASVSLLRYRDVLAEQASEAYGRYFDSKVEASTSSGTVSQAGAGLTSAAESPIHVPMATGESRELSPEPFDMTETNLQIYFLDRILSHQEGKKTVMVLTGVNDAMLGGQAGEDSGFWNNLLSIDRYMFGKPVRYVNMQGKLGSSSYADAVHYTPGGNRALANILWDELRQKE